MTESLSGTVSARTTIGLRAWTALVVVFVYLGVVGANWIVLKRAEEVQAAEAHKTVRAYSQLIAAAHELWLREFENTLTGLAAALPVDGPATPACRDQFARFLQETDGFDIVLHLDADGRVTCGPEGRGEGKVFDDRLYYKRARASEAFAVGAVIEGRISGKTVLPVALPRLTDDGRFGSMLVAGREIDWIAKVVDSHELPHAADILLFAPDGNVVARSENADRWEFDWTQLFQRLGASGSATADDPRGGTSEIALTAVDAAGRGPHEPVATIVAVQRLTPAHSGMVAAVAVPKSVMMRSVRDLRTVVVRHTALAGLVLVALLYIAIGQLVNRPLTRLMTNMEEVSTGRFETRPARHVYAAEIRRMWSAFHNMVTALQSSHAELEHLSVTDGLTGLANRRRFDQELARVWRKAAREGGTVSLALLDIDRFKPFNDGLGHDAGDACLRQVAETLRDTLRRPGDLLARYGGEELACILDNTDADGAHHVAEQLRTAVEALAIAHPDGGIVTASIGVATLPADGHADADVLIKAADQALYAAKNAGRNRVVVA